MKVLCSGRVGRGWVVQVRRVEVGGVAVGRHSMESMKIFGDPVFRYWPVIDTS